MSNSLGLRGLLPARLLCLWDFPARIQEWIVISFSRLHRFVEKLWDLSADKFGLESYPHYQLTMRMWVRVFKPRVSLYIRDCTSSLQASLVAQLVKNPPAVRETGVWPLCWEDPLEEGMATYSGILAWRIPMDRGAWWAAIHGVEKSQTRLSN